MYCATSIQGYHIAYILLTFRLLLAFIFPATRDIDYRTFDHFINYGGVCR